MSAELSKTLQENLKKAHQQLNGRGGGGRIEVAGDELEGVISVLRYPTTREKNVGEWLVSPGPLGKSVIDFLTNIQ